MRIEDAAFAAAAVTSFIHQAKPRGLRIVIAATVEPTQEKVTAA